MRVSWFLLVSYKFIGLVLFTGHLPCWKEAVTLGIRRYLLDPLGCLSLLNLRCSQGRAASGFKAVHLAQHHLLLRIPMRWQTARSPVSYPCHVGSRNHPVAFQDLQATLGTSISPGYGPRWSCGTFPGTHPQVGCAKENLALAAWSQGKWVSRGLSFTGHNFYRVSVEMREGGTNTQLEIGKKARPVLARGSFTGFEEGVSPGWVETLAGPLLCGHPLGLKGSELSPWKMEWQSLVVWVCVGWTRKVFICRCISLVGS